MVLLLSCCEVPEEHETFHKRLFLPEISWSSIAVDFLLEIVCNLSV